MFQIENTFISIGIWLVGGIYKVASWAFDLFLILATGSIVDTEDYGVLIKNFYVILGIIMLFIITFAMLKALVNPEEQKKGAETTKKIIMNLISSALIMVLLPTIFSFAYDFQKSVINDYNVFGKFFGYGDIDASNDDPTNGTYMEQVRKSSYQLVNGIYTAFFNVNIDNCDGQSLDSCQASVHSTWNPTSETFFETISIVNETGKFNKYNVYSEEVENEKIEFNFLLSLIAGAILVYVAVSFCFDMAVRMIKLVFYQLIAPIPIFFRVVPEGKLSGTFKEWTKVTLACYLEVYIRIFVFYFVIYLANLFQGNGYFGLVDRADNAILGLFVKAFILMGLVAFMRQAPKLLSEVTGIDSGNMKLGIKEKLATGGAFAAGAGLGALIASRGNPLAAYRAGKSGWKNGDFKAIGREAKRRQDYKEALKNGATRKQMLANSIRGAFGFGSTAEAAERKIKNGATTVQNNSPSNIEYTDAAGNKHTIISGGNVQIDDATAEELKAKKTQNIGAMSDANDKMRDLDKKISWATSQRKWKSDMDDEADKKFNDGKYEHDIRYVDSTGTIHEERVNGKRLSELSQQGMKFLYADAGRDTFTITYIDENGETQTKKGKTQTQIEEIIATGGTIVSQQIESVTEKKIRDEVRLTFSTQELSSNSPNLIKNKTEAFFTTLANEGGFSYQSFVYDENGRQIYKDGKAVIETGGFTSEIDENNNRIITHTVVDSNGTEHKTIFKSIGNGMLEYTDDEGNRKELSIYEMSDMFDQKSKSTTGVLEVQKQSIAESEEFIKARDENDAIDAVLKQREEKIAQELQSEKQRSREAAKNYHANRDK